MKIQFLLHGFGLVFGVQTLLSSRFNSSAVFVCFVYFMVERNFSSQVPKFCTGIPGLFQPHYLCR